MKWFKISVDEIANLSKVKSHNENRFYLSIVLNVLNTVYTIKYRDFRLNETEVA